LALACLLGLAAPRRLDAQVGVSLALPFDKAARFEALDAAVSLHNRSGRMLALDGEGAEGRFWLDVAGEDGRRVPRRDGAPLLPPASLMPGETRTFTVPVTRRFDLSRLGRYVLRAGVDEGGASFASPPVRLELAAGFELRRLAAGIPGAAGASREYVLFYLQKGGGENLYLRIEDRDQAVYGAFDLGRLVRVRPPDLRVDESGNVHVLFQTLGMRFVHAATTPNGVPLFSRVYRGVRGQASLSPLPNGQLAVLDAEEVGAAAPASESAPAPVPPPAPPAPRRGGLRGFFRRGAAGPAP